jgi:hypothetical protein
LSRLPPAPILTFGAILIPVHGSTVASLTQPVTLFETILTDLEQAYVDPIDTNKLFRNRCVYVHSLDPYTEFEGAQGSRQVNKKYFG